MKLDKIKFARLIAYIQDLKEQTQVLETYQIEHIDELTEINVEPVVIRPNNVALERLMLLMAEGTRKIEAIKEYRVLTGMGLKESKDAVEKYWINRGHYVPANQAATLGDILGKATGK